MMKISLRQDGMHLSGEAPKEQVEKMQEIASRDPAGTWWDRDFDLLEAAIKELEAEGKSQGNSQA